ncbi:hypothetical protein HMPREF0239_03211, partial [Clostridium sp. ATCC BAA-442]
HLSNMYCTPTALFCAGMKKTLQNGERCDIIPKHVITHTRGRWARCFPNGRLAGFG